MLLLLILMKIVRKRKCQKPEKLFGLSKYILTVKDAANRIVKTQKLMINSIKYIY